MPATNLDLFHRMPLWLASLLLLAALLAAIEIGFRAGRRARVRLKSEGGADLGTIQGAVLGLLGLLLAFTYAFVASRHDARKQAVIQEANALGTAYLRAGLFSEPGASELRQALWDYLDSRIIDDGVAADPGRLRAAIAESERRQARLWPLATKLIEGRTPTPIDALLLSSVNEVLDDHTRRLAAGRDFVPGVVLLMLYLVAAVAVGVSGFSGGLNNRRNTVLTVTLAVLITAVTLVILDLDHPRRGLIRVSQQSLVELRQNIETSPADAATPPA